MNLGIEIAEPHVDDGAIMRLLDREGPALERVPVAAHVETCGPCRQRRDRLAALSRDMSEALVRSDPVPRVFARARRGRIPPVLWRSWPAAAAVVLFVAGTIAVAAPVRMWMAERWIGLRELLHVSSGTERPQIPAREQSPAGMVSFVPESDVLTVRITTRQAEGALVFEASRASTASVTVRGQGDREAVVVLPDELRIANLATSRATYRVTLPARLRSVTVVVGGDRPLNLAPLAGGDSLIIDLSTNARR
ncbi:MAG TPA: DUF4402 domain-containing protein [Gemmatimonadales bacterium]|nr:DUF4402 domain-containing protein [Gemmatimonadales bacterium]